MGRIIIALSAIASSRGFEVDYIIARRPTKTGKKTIILKPKNKPRKKARKKANARS